MTRVSANKSIVWSTSTAANPTAHFLFPPPITILFPSKHITRLPSIEHTMLQNQNRKKSRSVIFTEKSRVVIRLLFFFQLNLIYKSLPNLSNQIKTISETVKPKIAKTFAPISDKSQNRTVTNQVHYR